MDIIILILFAIINIVNLSIAIHILASANKNRPNILFFWTLFTLVLWNITLFLSLPLYPGYTEASLVFFARLAYGFSILENLFVVLFAKEILFPLTEVSLLGKKYHIPKWIFTIITWEASIFFLITIATPLLYEGIAVEGNQIIADYFGPLYDWYSLHFLIFTILPITILFIKSRLATGIIQKKLFFLLIGFSIFHIIATVFNIILPALGNPSYYLVGGISFGLFGAFTLFIVFKYRFLGTKILLWKIVKVCVQLAIVAAIIVLTKIGLATSNSLDSYDYIILPAIALITFTLTNSFFFKNFYLGRTYNNLHTTIQELIAILKSSITVKEFRNILVRTFENRLGITNVDLYIIEGKLQYVDLAKYPQNELTSFLEVEKKEIVAEEWQYREVPLTPIQLKALVLTTILDAHVCIPLFHQNNLIGILALGAKVSQEPYYTDDIEQFQQLADYISSFLVTISLFKQEQQTKEELHKTQELASSSHTAQRLMHDMKNSIHSAYAIIREIKSKKDIHKMGKVEEKLLDLEESLSTKDGELQLSDLDLHTFFMHTTGSFTELFKEKNISYDRSIDIPESITSKCDRKKYKSIFENILYNAYKFTPTGGKVTCKALLNTTSTELLVTIVNTGDGIPASMKEHIFESGFTTDNTRGSGQGLDIVKKFIELHNGEIHEFGTEGVDTVFTIKLPVVTPDIVIFSKK